MAAKLRECIVSVYCPDLVRQSNCNVLVFELHFGGFRLQHKRLHFKTSCMLMASRPLVLGNEFPITLYSFPQYLFYPLGSFFYPLCSVIPLPAPQHSVKITTTCFREYSHITSDSRASPGDTRPASKDPVTLARPPAPHFTFTSWHYAQIA